MNPTCSRTLTAFFLGVALLVFPTLAAATPAMRRIAVVVGANTPPPGRPALRYAYDDARDLVSVLEQVGGFRAADVHLLLDPTPAELLTTLDGVAQALAVAEGEALVLFYYSGHSDGQALFPHGEPLPVADVRDKIERFRARIRVGILDTCRGGSWTQSKGLTVGPPIVDLLNVDTEGTALVSSSSGIEDAHEAEAVRGSFFTHHLTAGLRGAADRAGDGDVTLEEAFDYAKERTVRDSARLAKMPQHPSFDLSLHGRQDIVLTVISSNTSAFQITPGRGSVEIIQLANGVTVADVPPGVAPVRVALPPGRYLVRTVVDDRVFTKEFDVHDGETVTVGDNQLEATGSAQLAIKGAGHANEPLSIWHGRGDTRWLLNLGFGLGGVGGPTYNLSQGAGGVQTLDSTTVTANLLYRITDRLTWSVPWPAFSYRFGDPGGVEIMPSLGFAANSWNSVTGLSSALRGEVAARIWTLRNQWVFLAAGLAAPPYDNLTVTPSAGVTIVSSGIGRELVPSVFGGYGWTIRNLVTLRGTVVVDRSYVAASPSWLYEVQWLHLVGEIDVRLASRLSVGLSAGWATETHEELGSYSGFMARTTFAF
jgi:hypothetical protein